MSVDLRLMRYVIAVAEEGSFHRAAERLHIAQPPLSRQIRELERELGVELFQRRPTQLTEAGRVFTEFARKILTEVDEMVDRTIQAGSGGYGKVRIGYVLSAGYDTLPALLKAMAQEYPGIQAEASEGWTPELERALRDGALDVVLSRNLSSHPDITRTVLRREALIVVVNTTHPFAGRDTIALKELAGNTFCYSPRRYAPANYDALIEVLRSTGESFSTWEHPAPGLRHPPLPDDRSFTLFPESMANHLPPPTVGIRVTDDLPTFDLNLGWRRDIPAGPVRTLVDLAERLATGNGWK